MRFDEAFANARYIAGGADYPARWAAEAEAFRTALGERARLGLSYGPGARHVFDLFLPQGEAEGLVVFLHGGFWLAFGPRDFSHLAQGPVARGWACALPAYTLAPEGDIPAMVSEVRQAVEAAAELVGGPVAVTGHSAGGHLAARLACADQPPSAALARTRKVVPISPLSDLLPLIETSMNGELRLTGAVARAESPALLPRRRGVAVHVWVGGAERPRFLDQARRLGNAWSCPVTVEPGRHHFDVIDGLAQPDSPLMAALLG